MASQIAFLYLPLWRTGLSVIGVMHALKEQRL